jgi:hypothetical protein
MTNDVEHYEAQTRFWVAVLRYQAEVVLAWR